MFEIIGPLLNVETIAAGRGIRELRRLLRIYGRGRWRKRKGIAKLNCVFKMAASKRPKSTGTRRTGWGVGSSRSSVSSGRRRSGSKRRYVVCLSNEGYAASLEPRKIYHRLDDRAAERLGLVRIVDESGLDYLFPRACFADIALPSRVIEAFPAAP